MICRVCLRVEQECGPMSDIFVGAEPLCKKIMSCASVKIEKNDGLPSRICKSCTSNLRVAWQFKVHCENSDFHLRNSVHKQQMVVPAPQKIVKKVAAAVENKPKQRITLRKLKVDKKHTFKCYHELESYHCKLCDFKSDMLLAFREHHALFHSKTKKCIVNSRFNVLTLVCKKCKFETHSNLRFLKHSTYCETNCHTIEDVAIKSTKDVRRKPPEQPPTIIKYKDPLSNSRRKCLKCSLCPFSTVYKHSMQRHQLKKHGISEVFNFNCDMCNFETNRRESLELHKKWQHSVEDPNWLQCSECPFRCPNFSTLKKHSAEVHGNDGLGLQHVKAHYCDECGRGFRWASNLKTHKITHASAPLKTRYKKSKAE